MSGQVQLEGSLPHGGAGRYEHQVGGLHSRRAVVQIQEACGNAGDVPVVLGRRLYLVHGVHHHLPDGDIGIRGTFLHQLEYTFFRVLQYVFQAFLARVAGIGDVLVQAYQLPQDCLLRHDLGIGLDIGGYQRRAEELLYKFQAADLRRHILGAQTLLQRHQIHRFSPVVQLAHGVEQDSVLFVVEILPAYQLRGLAYVLPVQKHGADDGLLRLHVVGQYTFKHIFFHDITLLSLLRPASLSPGDAA